MELQGKTILITGAAQGLGQTMAELVAGQGADLALADVNHEKLKDTVRLCSKPGNKVRDYPTDVTREASVEQLFRGVQEDFAGLDGLINNAGVTSNGLLVNATNGKVRSKMTMAQFTKVIAVDLVGVFLCGREAAVRMVESGRGGVIINISSISRAGVAGQTNYSAAKAGVAAMTVTWARELARYRIRVAGIAPGFCETSMVDSIPPNIRDGITSMIPVRRFASPEEIARAALFILQNDYYVGRVLEIDGGLRF
jgi:3-oxoacyl-[acyl-carrier protein] reductase